MMDNINPQYILARSVLLDALQALEAHLNNLILVGAQAVYLHTNPASLRIPAFTTDADLILDTHLLAEEPEITGELSQAGFLKNPDNQNPGSWIGKEKVVVDLMVVRHQSGREKKKARRPELQGHDNNAARIVDGLEGAIVDNTLMPISSFIGTDTRSFHIRVAGPAALITAKLIKLQERQSTLNRPDRVNTKDALDLYRILIDVETEILVNGFETHKQSIHAYESSKRALDYLKSHTVDSKDFLPSLSLAAEPEDPRIPILFVELAQDLLTALESY